MTVEIARFHVTHGDGAIKAFASVKLNASLTIHGCKLMSGRNGLFVVMPSQKSEKDGKYYDDLPHPTPKSAPPLLATDGLPALREDQAVAPQPKRPVVERTGKRLHRDGMVFGGVLSETAITFPLTEPTGFCHSCGRVCRGVFCANSRTGADDTCRRRWEREQAVQANRAIRRGKRAGYGISGSTH